MAVYSVVNDKGFVVNVTLDPTPSGGSQTVTIRQSCQFVYQYSYDNYSSNLSLSYNIDGGNWISVANGASITIPETAKTMQVRLGYSLEITDTESEPYETTTFRCDGWTWSTNEDGMSVGTPINGRYETVIKYEDVEVTIYANSGTWYSGEISLNNSPSISGEDTDLGERSTAFSIEYTVNDTDTADIITVTCYYDDELIATIDNAIRNNKYKLFISNAMLAPGEIGSQHTIKIEASDGKGSNSRIYTFVKNRNPEPYADYVIAPVETDGMATIVVAGQQAGENQIFQTKLYVCNNAFDEHPMWEDASDEYNKGRAYHFINSQKTDEKWGISVRFVDSKYNELDQIDISGCGFWCDKMIIQEN